MPRSARPARPADPVRAWLALAEITVTAPLVIGQRTARLLAGGWPPGPRERREYARMWTEKAQALSRAAVVAATSVPGPATTVRILTPVRDRVRGNARRLSRG